MRCLDDVPAPETPPPLPDTHPTPGTPHPPAVPPLEDDEVPLPPPVQLPGRPGLPERVVAYCEPVSSVPGDAQQLLA